MFKLNIKSSIRAIGIDDSSFDKFNDEKIMIIGTVIRASNIIEGFMNSFVEVDGDDSTEKIEEMIRGSHFFSQIKVIFLDGISLAGFNVVDIFKLSKELEIPVIVIMRKNPDIKKIIKTLESLNYVSKMKFIKKLSKPVEYNGIFYQSTINDKETNERLIRLFTFNSKIPEPIRISHLIGQMIKFGESKGRA